MAAFVRRFRSEWEVLRGRSPGAPSRAEWMISADGEALQQPGPRAEGMLSFPASPEVRFEGDAPLRAADPYSECKMKDKESNRD